MFTISLYVPLYSKRRLIIIAKEKKEKKKKLKIKLDLYVEVYLVSLTMS